MILLSIFFYIIFSLVFFALSRNRAPNTAIIEFLSRDDMEKQKNVAFIMTQANNKMQIILALAGVIFCGFAAFLIWNGLNNGFNLSSFSIITEAVFFGVISFVFLSKLPFVNPKNAFKPETINLIQASRNNFSLRFFIIFTILFIFVLFFIYIANK